MKRLSPPSRKPRGLTRADREIWAYATRNVRPLAPERVLVEEPAAAEATEHPAASPAPPAVPAIAAKASAKPPPLAPIEPRLRRRLSRGQREVDARLDLHGMRQDGAHRALHDFLRQSHRAGAQVVLVITGKGSADSQAGNYGVGSGVLRRMVPHWLREYGLRAIVLGFEEAAQRQGGGGALYVRLRRGTREP